MKKLDVLIINPNERFDLYQELGNDLAAIEPPIWAALIAGNLLTKGYAVALLDAAAEHLTASAVVSKLPDYNAKLIVIAVYGQHPSASTQIMHAASKLCGLIKDYYPDNKVLFMGGHVSALPERTLLEERADFICQGEGTRTVSALLEIDLNDKSRYSRVPGLWYRDEGKPVFTFPAPLVQQEELASEFPGFAFDLLPMSNYRAHNWHCFGSINQRQPYVSIYTSLGCPFQCTFCCINAPFGKPGFRYWDPLHMIKQFDMLAEKYNVRNVKIADEMFVLNENHFLTLCRLLKERNHGFNMWAYARIDTVKPRYLAALKSAGINWLALGIESGSKHVRDGVSKGRFEQEGIRDIVKRIKDEGINIIGNYIFGLPDDNFDTIQETLQMAMELNCEMANFYSAMAYPGSELYDFAVKNKWELPETWLGYSQYSYDTFPLRTNRLRSEEILDFRDKAWHMYFTNPSYLASVKTKFGRETHDHIVEMTKHTLKRKYKATTGQHEGR